MRNFTSCLLYLLPCAMLFIACMLAMGGYEWDLLGLGFAGAACVLYRPCVMLSDRLWVD